MDCAPFSVCKGNEGNVIVIGSLGSCPRGTEELETQDPNGEIESVESIRVVHIQE